MSLLPHLPKPVVWAHTALAQVLLPGNTAVDATVGNGFDTLFLAQTVGPSGKIFGFDIQPQAIANTHALLRNHSIEDDRVTLLQTSHAEWPSHLPDPAKNRLRAITFNLGYLPGGDKSLTTLPDSTLLALDAARSLLPTGGLLSVVAYPGHSTGLLEARAVEAWMNSLSPSEFDVQHLRSLHRHRPPPELWLALKTRTPHLPDPIP